jgi:ABC-type transport system involved in Fe-S cluster assembly fused permease/ATPase subunit
VHAHPESGTEAGRLDRLQTQCQQQSCVVVAAAAAHRGVILEQGTHQELLAIPHGGYARLVAAQMKGGEGKGQ